MLKNSVICYTAILFYHLSMLRQHFVLKLKSELQMKKNSFSLELKQEQNKTKPTY